MGMMGMHQYFFTDVVSTNLLFKDLNINNTGEMVGACAIIFIATVIFEALKLLKQYLTLRLTENPLAGVQNSPDNSEGTPGTDGNDDVILVSSLQFPVTVTQIRNQRIALHVLSTLCHMLNFFYGYLLMLLVMTYNVWLTIAVIVGFTVGYFIFGNIGNLMMLTHLRQGQTSPTDCCGSDQHEMPAAHNVQASAVREYSGNF